MCLQLVELLPVYPPSDVVLYEVQDQFVVSMRPIHLGRSIVEYVGVTRLLEPCCIVLVLVSLELPEWIRTATFYLVFLKI